MIRNSGLTHTSQALGRSQQWPQKIVPMLVLDPDFPLSLGNQLRSGRHTHTHTHAQRKKMKIEIIVTI